MFKPLLIGLLLLISCSLSAQITTQIGARQNALGNASANLNNIWAVKNNPGAFAFMQQSAVSLVYQNRFLVNEMATQSAVYGHHTDKGNVGLYIQHTGFNLFRTMQVGGTYAMALSPRLGLGMTFNYQQTRFGDIYGVKHHFMGNIGVNYKLNNNVSIGATVQNINRSRVSDFQNERLPTAFILGMMYQISDKVLWLIDAEKEITSPLNIKSGLELTAHENFIVRLGVNTYPFQSSFGFGLHIKKLQIDLAAIWHAQIGLTPSMGIVYQF